MSKYDQYKESAFTHEEMQPMIIETDMTDIVERLRGKLPMEHDGEGMIVDDDAVLDMFEAAADEIERLRGWLINLRGDVLDVAGACNRLSDQIGKVLGEESDD